MVFKVKPKAATPAAVIKDGTYRATVSNLKQFANTYGERIGFEFTIQGGQFDGERVMRSTAPQLSKQSKLAEVIEGILGRELTDKELQGGFDLDELIDKECNIRCCSPRARPGDLFQCGAVFCT